VNKRLLGEPYPSDKKQDSIHLLRTWLMTQPYGTKVSSTRAVKHDKEKHDWETYWVGGVNLKKIDDFMNAGLWEGNGRGAYTAREGGVSWDAIARFLDAAGHTVTEQIKIKKKPQYVLNTLKRSPIADSVVFSEIDNSL
jgi:hypothetical protein